MLNKIYILIGISGSGKSTYAFKLQRTTDSIIVSRDLLRMQLFGYSEETYKDYYKLSKEELQKHEEIVTKFHDNQIWYAIQNNKNIIVDNTHLRKEFINHYKNFGCILEPHIISTSLDISILRDSKRTKKVGEEVIKKQYQNFETLNKDINYFKEIDNFNKELRGLYTSTKKKENLFTKPNCIIFDIDNTLALKGDRNAYDWSKVCVDKPNIPVIETYRALESSGKFDMIICSGRDEVCREETESWLNRVGVKNYKNLYMRVCKDFRKDYIVKMEFWRDIQKDYEIVSMFDDRQQVISMGRKLGYSMNEVNYGNF